MPSDPAWITPDDVVTTIGSLRLLDARPDPDTVGRVADRLLSGRVVEAFLATFPVVSVEALPAPDHNVNGKIRSKGLAPRQNDGSRDTGGQAEVSPSVRP